jgi:3-oxoacyl-[acyl-carrier-protein] synthase-3
MISEYYIPKKKLSNSDLEKLFPDFTASKISNKVGIEERGLTEIDEYASDLACRAALKLFDKKQIDKNEIDFLIYCTQSPDYSIPTTACILQDRLELSTGTGAIDINQGCSGFIYGLAICKGLIFSGIANNILLLTSDTYTKYIDKLDKGNKSIFGDGATATLISNLSKFKFLEFSLGSDGSGHKNLIVPNSGLRDKVLNVKPTLYMNGTEIFNFTLKSIPNLLNDVLDKNNLDINDIDLFIFHQANKFMLEHLARKLKIPIHKFIIDMKNTGNTVSSTIPICINKHFDRFKKSRYILLCGFGVGYSWGACVIENEI